MISEEIQGNYFTWIHLILEAKFGDKIWLEFNERKSLPGSCLRYGAK